MLVNLFRLLGSEFTKKTGLTLSSLSHYIIWKDSKEVVSKHQFLFSINKCIFELVAASCVQTGTTVAYNRASTVRMPCLYAAKCTTDAWDTQGQLTVVCRSSGPLGTPICDHKAKMFISADKL